MQDRREIHEQRNYSQDFSSHDRRDIAEIKAPLQAAWDLSSDALEQLILTLPAGYREMVIRAVAEQFVIAMRLHMLQVVALFYQYAEKEGISAEDREETLQDVEADIQEVMALNQKLSISSVENLLRPGKITASVKNLT